MQGYILRKLQPPNLFPSYQSTVVVPAGATRRINIPAEFKALAKSMLLMNRDGTNTARVITNTDERNAWDIPPNLSVPINDIWTEQIEIRAGALGPTNAILELVPLEEVLK